MADAPGIAGSRQPEEEGCFLCMNDFEVSFFVRINNTGGPVDVWAVEGINDEACHATKRVSVRAKAHPTHPAELVPPRPDARR